MTAEGSSSRTRHRKTDVLTVASRPLDGSAVMAHARNRSSIVICALLLGACASRAMPRQGHSRNYDFVKQWGSSLGGQQHTWNIAVCPGGEIYVVDEEGGAKFIGSDGKLVFEQPQVATPSRRTPVACGPQNQLYVFDGLLKTLSKTPAGKLRLESSTRLPYLALELLAAPDGSAYVLGVDHPLRYVIAQIPTQSTGWRVLADGVVSSLVGAARVAILDWDPHNRRIIYVLPGDPEIRFLDPKASLPAKGVRSYSSGAGPFVPSAEWLGLAILSNGNFLAQRRSKSEIADVFDSERLVLLNPTQEVLWSADKDVNFGVLLGASSDGGLYFLSSSGELVRCALVETNRRP